MLVGMKLDDVVFGWGVFMGWCGKVNDEVCYFSKLWWCMLFVLYFVLVWCVSYFLLEFVMKLLFEVFEVLDVIDCIGIFVEVVELLYCVLFVFIYLV